MGFTFLIILETEHWICGAESHRIYANPVAVALEHAASLVTHIICHGTAR